MRLLSNELYKSDLGCIAALPLPWEKLSGAILLISGATGMIGSFLIDVLMNRPGTDCRIYAVGRSMDKLRSRFAEYLENPRFIPVVCDINDCAPVLPENADYIIHAASSTHPVAYAADPIGTVTANIIGANNLLSFGAEKGCRRFLFCSSVEIYGENRGDTELFTEDYLGYINCNTMRAGYPESKRAGEALCQAYRRQKGLDVVIARLARTFGPTMLSDDTKAISQFIRKSVAGEDIVLKSEGKQFYSYTYVADAVGGLLTCLLKGEDGEAYNIAGSDGNISLRDLAVSLAEMAGTRVVFELPEEAEKAGYSTASVAALSGEKLSGLGYRMAFSLKDGLYHTRELLIAAGN